MATVKVEGLEDLHKRLQKAAKEVAGAPGGSITRAMKRSVYKVVFDLADYPPIGASSYRRTGTLGRRWFGDVKISKVTGGVEGRAANNTVYGPWVQSQQFQTRVHARRGWITDRKALDKNQKWIDNEFNAAVRTAIGE